MQIEKFVFNQGKYILAKKLNEISNIMQRPISTINDIIMKSKVQLCNNNKKKEERKN